MLWQRILFGLVTWLLVPSLAFAQAPSPPAAGTADEEELMACFVPASGTIYRIGIPGLPQNCLSTNHVRFSWHLRGPQGMAGPAGVQGAPGNAGPAGPVGAVGSVGPQGTQGYVGPAGPQGIAGPAGAAGPQGPPGNDGAVSPAGAQGPQGNDGPAGPAGSQGIQGIAGPAGAPGPAGPAGPAGSTRVVGATVTSAAGANTGTLTTATASCAAGKVLLGGGADVTTNGTPAQGRRAVMASSYPSSTTTWTAVGVVTDSNLAAAQTLSVTAFALCSL